MDDADRFKSGGLPRHSFVEDPFFRGAQADIFRDFGNPADGGGSRQQFGSNPRLFDDNFFENFSCGGSRNFGDGSFFRSSLPRRPMNFDTSRFEQQQPYRQQTVLQRSPSQPPSNADQNGYNGTPPSDAHVRFATGNPYSHQRQSSSGSAYDSFPSVNRSASGGPPISRAQQQSEKIHVIPVRHEKQHQQHSRDHRASNSNIVEINSAGPDGYTNGQLNPDRRKNVSNVSHEHNSRVNVPSVHVEDFEDGKPSSGTVNAISDIPIPLPSPAQFQQPNSSGNQFESDKNHDMNGKVAENIEELHIDPNELANINAEEMPKEPLTQAEVNCIIQHIDDIERRVEQFRERASQLEQDKEFIFDLLNNIHADTDFSRLGGGDKEDITIRTAHLLKRCSTVTVEVNTPRNEEQTRALVEVNASIDNVVKDNQSSVETSRQRLERFLNACNPDEPSGPIDEKFQIKIVECTADDQKKVRRRLVQLIEQMQRAERHCLATIRQ